MSPLLEDALQERAYIQLGFKGKPIERIQNVYADITGHVWYKREISSSAIQ